MNPESVGAVIPLDVLIQRYGELPPWVHLMPVILFLVGTGVGYLLRGLILRARKALDTGRMRQTLDAARQDAANIRRKAELDAVAEVLRAREKFEQESHARRQELAAAETRLDDREKALALRDNQADAAVREITVEKARLESARRELEERTKAFSTLEASAIVRLHQIAGLSREEARRTILDRLQEELKAESGQLIRRAQEEAAKRAAENARDMVLAAAERYAASQISEITTTHVALPSEEMKGRIIGREGRNIRSLESTTGCNILIDETPQTIVISGFDPQRREIARRILEKLISDGRINPARIEEVAAEVRAEVEAIIRQAGEAAIAELHLEHVDPELVHIVGSLKFRHSFSQNVLQHAIEVAHLMGMMAPEVGLDAQIARRIGLFHDVGKAVDHTVEGGHAGIGAALLKRHGEAEVVCDAVAAHHRDTAGGSAYAALLVVADTLTAARPGARTETTEFYLQRLANLEALATAMPGVKSAFAMQAGRELRVFVSPEEVDDDAALKLARDLAKAIQEKLQYPGQIKITVIRETRCVEFAR